MIEIETKVDSAPVMFAVGKFRTLTDSNETVIADIDRSLPEQGYSIIRNGKIYVTGGDDAGCMYGLLDVYHAIQANLQVQDKTCSPLIKKRGIKFNIPLDARTPSYSDAGSSARSNIENMWDMLFWAEFLDRMAENKYNVLSLWSLCPYPSMVKVPGFLDVSLDDVKVPTRPYHAKLSGKGIFDSDQEKNLVTVRKMTIDKKIDFWKRVMRYASDRCIEVYLFTWNLFADGDEFRKKGMTDDPNNPIIRQYLYEGTKALFDTYPLLSGIGVTAGENLTFNGSEEGDTPFDKTDVGFIHNTYGRAVNDYLSDHPEKHITYIHRMQMSKYDRIMSAYRDFKGNLEISFKYSQAHMYSSTKPGFINSFLNEKANGVKIWLTVRNDDFYMFRWGDPDFAREYIKNMPIDCMSGFYMGADGFTWGRDYMTSGSDVHGLFVDKMWYMFKLWGELSYDPTLPDSMFIHVLQNRFTLSENKAKSLFVAWKEASDIISDFDCTHWHDFDFQWYPEGCCMYLNDIDKTVFANILEFMECDAIPYSNYLSVKEYVAKSIAHIPISGITPFETIRSIEHHIAIAQKNICGLTEYMDPELIHTLNDIKMLCLLGKYYTLKEEAAIYLSLYKVRKERPLQEKAVSLLKEAAPVWKKYSSFATAQYYPQVLTRLCSKVDLRDFDEQTEYDIALAEEIV